jgi:hypothetical protein
MPDPVVVRELVVITRRGHAWVTFLAVVGILLAIAGGVAVFAGAPPEVEPWKWPMVGAGLALIAAAIAKHYTRRRKLTITRVADRYLLAVVEENVEIELPVRCSGAQLTTHVNGVPLHTVFLKAIDVRGRGVLFQETRGAAHGRVGEWFAESEQTGPLPTFETSRVGMIVELRDLMQDPC